jgi:glycosyltransferase involved in cell wall biosynthesis
MNGNEMKNGHSKDIIYVSSIPWDFSWHRQQEMMMYMSEHGFKILFVEPCDKKHPFQRFFKQECENVWRLRPCGFPYERCSRLINIINGKMARTEIEEAARQLKFEKPILWLDRVHGFDFEYFQKNSFVVYDLVDEILAFGRVRNDRMLLELENQVLKRADVLLSSSQTLMNRKITQSGRTGKSQFLPNGVDCSRFSIETGKVTQQNPTIGFIGHISKRSINYNLVQSVAAARPDWTLLFVGPGTEEDKNALKERYPNIVIQDPVSGAEVPRVIRDFDIGMIPYNTDKEDMDYVFPRKACEYLAAGKPVISTPLKEVECLRPYVQVATDAEGFIRKAEEVTDENEIATEARRTFAQKYDWDFLMKGLVAILSQPNESGT